MLVISVELLHGTIRAGSADDIAMTGAEDPGEWPPSPARLFSALVAGDGTRQRCRVTDGSELAVLEGAAAPRILADPLDAVCKSPLRDRFVVVDGIEKNSVQNYPARKSSLVRPGTRICPRNPTLHYVWDDLDVDGEVADALSLRAARIGYLGCADSPVRVSVSTTADAIEGPAWVPDPEGDVAVPVPFVGFTELLDRAYDSAGGSGRRSGFRSERIPYADPGARRRDPRAVYSHVFWLRVMPTLSGRHLTRLTAALKAAVLDLYSRSASDGQAPAVLHGHGFAAGQDYQLAYWLGLPDVGGPHSNGRIYGAAVALPAGTEPVVIEGVREALLEVCRNALTLPDGRSLEIQMFSGDRRPWATNPVRWTSPSRRWVSAYPVVYERWCRPAPDLSEVARWCDHAGRPEPQRMRLSEVPLLAGAVPLRGHEVYRREDQRTPFMHLEIEFAEEVQGPLVLGRMRQHGLGLMAPVRESHDG